MRRPSQPIYIIGGRRSWRVGAVCKTVVIALSGSESHPSDQWSSALHGVFLAPLGRREAFRLTHNQAKTVLVGIRRAQNNSNL